jgi:hypothetical protein
MKLIIGKLGFLTLLVLPFLFVSSESHAETGCVKNNAAFVAAVDWWRPNQVYVGVDGNTGDATFNLTPPENPNSLQHKAPTVGFRPCAPSTWDQKSGLVSVRISGANFITKGTDIAATLGLVGACYGGIVGATALTVATAGAAAASYIPAAAGCTALSVKLAASVAGSVVVDKLMPHAEQTFIVTTIPTGCELRVGGTAFKPIANLYQVGVKPKQRCAAVAFAGNDVGEPE